MNSNKRSNWIGLTLGIVLVLYASYISITNFRIFTKDDLMAVKIKLAEDPKYDKRITKGSVNNSISLQSYQYTKPFMVTNFTFNSVDHKSLKSEIKKSCQVNVYIPKSNLNSLRTEKLANNYNEIYDIKYNGKSYIDLEDRNEYQKSQNFWGSILFFGMGGYFIFYYSKKIKKVANNGEHP